MQWEALLSSFAFCANLTLIFFHTFEYSTYQVHFVLETGFKVDLLFSHRVSVARAIAVGLGIIKVIATLVFTVLSLEKWHPLPFFFTPEYSSTKDYAQGGRWAHSGSKWLLSAERDVKNEPLWNCYDFQSADESFVRDKIPWAEKWRRQNSNAFCHGSLFTVQMSAQNWSDSSSNCAHKKKAFFAQCFHLFTFRPAPSLIFVYYSWVWKHCDNDLRWLQLKMRTRKWKERKNL